LDETIVTTKLAGSCNRYQSIIIELPSATKHTSYAMRVALGQLAIVTPVPVPNLVLCQHQPHAVDEDMQYIRKAKSKKAKNDWNLRHGQLVKLIHE
jgi:hypothetical protein